MNVYAMIVGTLAPLTVLGMGVFVLVGTTHLLPTPRERLYTLVAEKSRDILGAAWGISLVATLGSLYLSEGAGLIPCELCWFQRIAMYPLAIILGIAFLRNDGDIWRYALPLPCIGALISGYHILIQLRPNLDVVSCSSEVPCTARYLAMYGFISIPVMAGTAFLLILLALVLVRRTAGPSRT